ncbi:hypothetical protein BC834DRAFT_845118 [Gloeopeniophorella convolvens]|nr:hypothetical protein BC834DRAFT_845118 [Gloeopeniophorella convolvens]
MAGQIVVRRLDSPTPEQIDAAVKLSVRAYAGDICEKVFTNADASRADALWRSLILAGARDGMLYVAAPEGDDPPDAVRAIAVWFPPGKLLWSTQEQLNDGFATVLAKLEPEHHDWLVNKFLTASNKLKMDIFGPERERDAMYASHIATDPDYQRRGLATALIRHVLAEVAEQADPPVVALGTQHEKNAKFARSLGFIQKGQLDYDTPNEWGKFTGNIFIHESSLQTKGKEAEA